MATSDDLDKLEKDIVRLIDERDKALTERIDRGKDIVDSDRKSLNDLMLAAKWFVSIFSVLAIMFSFFIGKTVTDVSDTAKKAAENAFKDAIRYGNADGKDLSQIISAAAEANAKIKKIEGELSGYSSLAEVAKSASGFDPLVVYYSIDKEIDEREEVESREKDAPIEKTTKSAEFRQRAAVVFEKLLNAVEDDKKTGRRRLDAVTLYNAGANASKIDMDFVALELMEQAATYAPIPRVEIEARLIRHRLSLARISNDQAEQAIAAVLRRTKGFDLHHAVSEAFNIGIYTSDPVRMAGIISNNIAPEYRDISYVKLNKSRLLLRGSAQKDWAEAESAFVDGVRALKAESPTARWIDASRREVAIILGDRPDFFAKHRADMDALLSGSSSLSDFVKRHGGVLTRRLNEMGVLSDFIRSR